MWRNQSHHLLSRVHQRHFPSQKLRLSAKRCWFASTIEATAAEAPSATRGRRIAAYITACTTAGAFTCYRPDELIAQDPYNVSSSLLALIAHKVVNQTASWSVLPLIGALVVGEFLGNGFRHINRQFFSITVTDQERHQLLDEVAKITDSHTHDMDKDLLDTFENTISNILIQAKTRWVHLSDLYLLDKGDNKEQGTNKIPKIPDQMNTSELKMAIHKMNTAGGVAGDEEEKEALLQVLSVADINGDGVITFHEFSRALLLLEFAKRDNPNAKAELYFRAIDLHNSGMIEQQELLHFAKRLYQIGGIPHKDRTTPHWSGMYERLATPEEICAKWMQRFDLNHDGLISREEFYKMAKEIDFGPSFLFPKYFERTPEGVKRDK